MIILFDPFANFRCGYPHDRVRIRVVIGRAPKNLYAENALLELVGLARQNSSYDQLEETWIALTGIK